MDSFVYFFAIYEQYINKITWFLQALIFFPNSFELFFFFQNIFGGFGFLPKFFRFISHLALEYNIPTP